MSTRQRAFPRPLGRLRQRSLDHLVAVALVAAGVIHLVLIPSHFRESTLFGAVFVAIAALQIGLALALLQRPGTATYRLALGATLGIVAVWAGTRFVTPPTGDAPEEVDLVGVVATGVELGTVVLLASALPAMGETKQHRIGWALATALGFAVLFLIASGSAASGSAEPGAPLIDAYTVTGDLSITIPALVVLVKGGWAYVTLPWSTALFLPLACLLLAVQVYLAMGLAACGPRATARRRGVLSLVPSLFAAPVCCGAPLAAFLGTSAVTSAISITPWVLVATCLLLAAGVWRLRQQTQRTASGGVP
jgi:hypothetical protein